MFYMSSKPHTLINSLSILSAALLFSSYSCLAQSSSSAKQPTEQFPVLKVLENDGLKILGQIEVPGGLQAFAAQANGQILGVYLTPDHQHAIVGTLVNAAGQDVATTKIQELASLSILAEGWKKVEAAKWVQDGNPDAPRTIYTFTDPNCPYCNRFWHAARPWVASEKVQLRHIMVGVIKENSPAKAAAILEANSPEEAMTYNETHQENGGIKPATSISPAIADQLEANANLLSELGFGGTPALVFKKDDGTIGTAGGLPTSDELEAILGPK